MSLFTVNRLTFAYNGNTVLRDITFTVDSGSTWAVIGMNGAGKSSLIKCLGRLVAVPHGAILIDGKEINGCKPRDLATVVGYVPQASGRTAPPFKVAEFVMMGRFPYQGFLAVPGKADRTIVEESMELTDTTQLADRFMPSLSGGELQRVLLAGAVAQRTRAMLLDEPVAFLDPLHQELVRRALVRIHDEYGTTIVTVTHDINAALTRYGNVLALVDGSVFFAGTTAEFRSRCPEILSDVFSINFAEAKLYGSDHPVLVPEVLL